MSQDTNKIINTLGKMRLKSSVSLGVQKKATMLRTVFNTAPTGVVIPRYRSSVPSPYMVLISQYVLPLFVLFFVGTQFGDSISDNAKLALNEFNTIKSDIEVAQKSAELKNSLSLNKKDIVALKAAGDSESTGKTELINSVTTRSQDIRNQVASLVKENKITEAKQIVLTLETALKADELYKVATSVSETVFSTTDLRVDIENIEIEATTSAADLLTRIVNDKKVIADMEVNASTTDLIADATAYLTKAEEYIAADNTENAIISLQAHDRIVAEIKLILVP